MPPLTAHVRRAYFLFGKFMKYRIIFFGWLVLEVFLAGCASLPARNVSYLPSGERLNTLEIQKGPDRYDGKNLYDLMDGEAEVFLSYGYRSAEAAEYVVAGQPQEKIYARIFDMASHFNAFGIYSSFINPEGEHYKLGAQGFFSRNTLIFYKGKYFIQVFSSSQSREITEHIKDLGARIEKNIKGDTAPPSALNLLPDENLVLHSKMYVPEGVLGISPLRGGVIGRYVVEGREVTAFICTYTEPTSAQDALFKILKQLDAYSFDSDRIKGKLFARRLKSSGEIIFCKKGRHIIGIKGLEKKEDGLPLLRKLFKKL